MNKTGIMGGDTVIAKSTLKILEQVNRTEDPVLKFSLFLKAMRFLTDIGLTYIVFKCDENNEELACKLENETDEKEIRKIKKSIECTDITTETWKSVGKLSEEYFDNFEKWIAQPIYSVDHPYGKKVANESYEKYFGDSDHN